MEGLSEISLERSRQQLEFLNGLMSKGLPVYPIGGFADDALLYNSLSRPHGDIDLVALRSEEGNLRTVLFEDGFSVEDVVVPPNDRAYKIKIKKDLVIADIVLLDVEQADQKFSIDLVNPSNGQKFRISFDKNSLNYPKQAFESFQVNTVSPLTLIKSKGIYRRIGSNEGRVKDDVSSGLLIKKYFPEDDISAEKFLPEITKL